MIKHNYKPTKIDRILKIKDDYNSEYGTLQEFVDYPLKVLSGEIKASRYIKNQCNKFLLWLKQDKYVFDEEKALKPVRFIAHLRHTEGSFAHKPFILLPWQRNVCYNTFGFYHEDTGIRVIHNVYIECCRKVGKTAFASAIEIYMAFFDGEEGSSVLGVAPSREQTKIAFNTASHFIETINKSNLFKCTRNEISMEYNHSSIKMMSSDASFGDGFSPHLGLVDEYHALKDNAIPDVLISGTAYRKNYIMFYITTCGFDLYGPCKQYRDMCVDILDGIKQDDTIAAFIYELDDYENWDNPDYFEEFCPSIDVTVSKDFILDQINKAKNNPSLLTGVQTKTCNMWVQAKDVWIPDEYIRNSFKRFDFKDIADDSSMLYVGVDLSSISDFTVASVLMPKDGKYYYKTYVFLPKDSIDNSVNAQLYKQWIKQGDMIVTPGNVVDYDYIINTLMKLNADVPIVKILYDSWAATAWATKCTELGLPLVPFAQGLGNFSSPTKELERQFLQGNIVMYPNDCVRWCFGNVTLKEDWNENVKPVKQGKKSGKIDTVIGMIEALGGYIADNGGYVSAEIV